MVKRVFCVELTTLVKMHGTKVPVVVSSCIEEMEKRGRAAIQLARDTHSLSLYQNSVVYLSLSLSLSLSAGLGLEGLYRVSGMTSEVLRIKKEFDRGRKRGHPVNRLFVHRMIWCLVHMTAHHV